MTVENFFTASLFIGMVVLALSIALVILRLLRGPTLADRVLALDLFTVLSIEIIGLVCLHTLHFAYLDVAIALALVGFLSTVAFARYVQRRGVQAREELS
jgi:multicomponent Na+:H+ antiporter subunit F